MDLCFGTFFRSRSCPTGIDDRREPVFIHVLNSVPSQFTHATRDRRHTVCRSSSSLSPLVRGVHLSNSRVRLKPRRRVYSVGLEPAAMNVAGSALCSGQSARALRTGRWHCAAAVPAAGLSYFQHRCRSTELSVPATGGEPVAWRRAGPSQHEHHCSCGATAGRSWSRRADKLLVATSIHEACGLRDACAAAAAPPSKCEQQWRGPGSGTGQRRERLPTAARRVVAALSNTKNNNV